MKYILLIMICLSFVLGCSSKVQSDPKDANTVELVVWITYKGEELKEFDKVIARFTEQYEKKHQKKIKILPKQVPYDDLVNNIKMACLSKKTPDIARVDVQKVLELAYHKVVIKLDQLPNFDAASIQDKAKDYMPGSFKVNVVETRNRDGSLETHLYGLPEQASCLGLFWNRRMFKAAAAELTAAGLDPNRAPRTWDEFVAYGKVLTRDGKYGFGMKNSLWWTFPFFGLYNVQFVKTDEQGKKVCILGDDRSCAALQLKVDLYRKYKVEAGAWVSGGLDPEMGFVNEKYAMVLMGPWFVKTWEEKGLDFGVALIPSISEEEGKRLGFTPPNSATNVGGNSMVIFETCKHKEIAYEFINYLASWENQVDWCKALKQIPVHIKAADIILGKIPDPRFPNETYDVPEKSRVFMEQVQYSVLPMQLPRYDFIEENALNPEMELALDGKKSVPDALRAAAQKITDHILYYVNE